MFVVSACTFCKQHIQIQTPLFLPLLCWVLFVHVKDVHVQQALWSMPTLWLQFGCHCHEPTLLTSTAWFIFVIVIMLALGLEAWRKPFFSLPEGMVLQAPCFVTVVPQSNIYPHVCWYSPYLPFPMSFYSKLKFLNKIGNLLLTKGNRLDVKTIQFRKGKFSLCQNPLITVEEISHL
jgi:hypothetical protein